MRGDQILDLAQFLRRNILRLEQTLNERTERAVERILERVEQLALLSLRARDGGVIQCWVALLVGLEQPLPDHAIHERADGAVGPGGLFGELLLELGRSAGLLLPDGLDDGP